MTELRDIRTFRASLGARIEHCARLIGTKGGAASAAGVTPRQLNRWIKGAGKVPVEALPQLAQGADVSFAWLATGEGNSSERRDHPLLPAAPHAAPQVAAARPGAEWWVQPATSAPPS